MKRIKISRDVLFNIMVIVPIVYFFLIKNPMIPFDSDDWLYLGMERVPFPDVDCYNPIKVFPELVMPFIGLVSGKILYPIIGDYVFCVSIVSGIIASVIVSSSVLLFIITIQNSNYRYHTSYICGAIFIIISFVLFWKHDGNSLHMFFAGDMNSVFNYAIPCHLSFVCSYFLINIYENHLPITKKHSNLITTYIILGILIYFSIFSSIQFSIILATISFVSGCLIFRESNKKGKWFVSFIIGVLWIISLLFEMQGQRAKDLSNQSFFVQSIFDTLKDFFIIVRETNCIILFISGITIGFGIFVSNRSNINNRLFKIFSISFIITFIYILLLYTKIGKGYMADIACVEQILTFYAFLVAICAGYIIEHFVNEEHYVLLMKWTPIVFVICIIAIMITSYPTIHVGGKDWDYEMAKKVDDIIISQVIDGSDRFQEKVEIIVPVGNKDLSNWPHSYGLGNQIKRALYRGGVITTTDYDCVIVPSDNFYFNYIHD